MSDDTSLRVSKDLADELYERKGRGTSYEDFIWDLLSRVDSQDKLDDRAVDDDQDGSHDRAVDDEQDRALVEDDQEDSDDQEGSDDDLPDELQRRMESQVASMDIKGRPTAVKRARRDALIYAWDRLREEGEMQPKRLADDVIGQFFDNPDLNYSVSASGHPGYQLLDNFLREAMLDLPGVHSTGRVWQFRED